VQSTIRQREDRQQIKEALAKNEFFQMLACSFMNKFTSTLTNDVGALLLLNN